MEILNSFSVETTACDFVDVTTMGKEAYLLAITQHDYDDERSAEFTKEELEFFAKKILAVIRANK